MKNCKAGRLATTMHREHNRPKRWNSAQVTGAHRRRVAPTDLQPPTDFTFTTVPVSAPGTGPSADASVPTVKWLGGRPAWLKSDPDTPTIWLGRKTDPDLVRAIDASTREPIAPRYTVAPHVVANPLGSTPPADGIAAKSQDISEKAKTAWNLLKSLVSISVSFAQLEALKAGALPWLVDTEHFTDVGWARKSFLADTFGAPFEPPIDDADKAEWDRGAAMAAVVIAAEALASRGKMGEPPNQQPQLVPIGGSSKGGVVRNAYVSPFEPPILAATKENEDVKTGPPRGQAPKEQVPVKDPPIPEDTHGLRDTPGGRGPRESSEVGNWVHGKTKNFERLRSLLQNVRDVVRGEIPADAIPEYIIRDGSSTDVRRLPRIDRLDRTGRTVIEIKPHHLYEQGLAEAKAYALQMDKFEPLPDGMKWQAKCVTYDMPVVRKYLIDIGYLEVAAPKVGP